MENYRTIGAMDPQKVLKLSKLKNFVSYGNYFIIVKLTLFKNSELNKVMINAKEGRYMLVANTTTTRNRIKYFRGWGFLGTFYVTKISFHQLTISYYNSTSKRDTAN